MDNKLALFLKTVEGYLKNMPISERIDVIKELKSSIEELQLNDTLSADEILERLGSPKALAAGYLGDRISTDKTLNLKKILMLISFYSLTSLSGMFVIPCGTVLAGGLILSGFISPVAGLIKFAGHVLGFTVPFGFFQFGSFELHPLITFPFSIVLGILFYLSGKAVWKAVVTYIGKVSAAKRAIDIMM